MKSYLNRCLGLLLAAATFVSVSSTDQAHAAGLLIADGGLGGVLEIKEHDVKVTINNGVAVTKVTQIFKTTEQRQVEALYTFPVPKGASVANFSMWINGKEMVGEVVEKQRARKIYNSCKAVRRDPGLLEQVDYRTFEMRIFPIAALESPSHGNAFVVAKHSDDYWQASLATRGGSLARDIVIACHPSRPQTGIDLITSKQSNEDGFFCLTLNAGEDLAKPRPAT